MSDTVLSQSNIERAVTLIQGISDRDPSLVTKYVNLQVFQSHNPRAYDGIQGLLGFVSHLPPQSSLRAVRAFQDGAYVFTHSEGDVFGRKVLFDIFRFEDGLIVEHWDNLKDWTPANESGHTPVDGPTEASDRQQTEKNKALVREFYEATFLRGDFSRMHEFFAGDQFIRHDARGGDGLSALGVLMHEQAQRGIVMQVEALQMILGEGDFVLATASGSIAGEPVAYYDLFRIEDGKLAEHWDVIEHIPPVDQWKNQNGKF